MSGKIEGENKPKKVTKEKRSVKKTKEVALPAKEIPAAEAPSARKSTDTGTATRPVRSDKAKEVSYEQVQLRAYFIGENRKSLGIPGDQTSDWVQAEIELKAELAPK